MSMLGESKPARYARYFVTFAGLLLAACGDTKMNWSEQVRLEGGMEVVVTRTASFHENWIPGGGGGSINNGMTLKIAQPEISSNPDIWNARFVPIVFDRDARTQEWFVVATFFHCDSWYELGRPRLPYTQFVFRNGKWLQQELDQRLIGRAANVLPADLSRKEEIAEGKPIFTAERKERILANPAIAPEYKRIVSTWATSC